MTRRKQKFAAPLPKGQVWQGWQSVTRENAAMADAPILKEENLKAKLPHPVCGIFLQ